MARDKNITPLELRLTEKSAFEHRNQVKLVRKRDVWFFRAFSVFVPSFAESWTTYRLLFQKRARITYPEYVRSPMEHLHILQHELIRAKDLMKWYGPVWMLLLATILPLPIYFSGRWFIERHAYLDDIKRGVRTVDSAVSTLWSAYGRPWPRSLMRQWFLKNLDNGVDGG